MSKKKLTNEEFIKSLTDAYERATGDLSPEQSEALSVNFGTPLDEMIKKLTNNKPGPLLSSNQGVFQTNPPEPTMNFVRARNEKVIGSRNNNAQIVFGRDRPNTLSSGMGGKGAAAANTIDIVVGRMSCKNDDISKGKIKAVDPHLGCDASRIYISQLTDVDLNFGLAPGISGKSAERLGQKVPSRAAIGMKSDKIRIIGREGVKIVTGKSHAFSGFGNTGETNSLGGTIPVAAPIELIAGNNSGTRKVVIGGLYNPSEKVENLQGVPYGENLNDALTELAELLDYAVSALDRLALFTEAFTTVAGITWLEPHRAGAAPITVNGAINFVNNALHHLRIGKQLWKINYLTPYGGKYIVSQNVFAT